MTTDENYRADIAAIQRALNPVVGLPWQCIGRAATLAWLHFGRMRPVTDRPGRTKTVGDWAIHLSCPWRVIQNGRIILGTYDFYNSPDGLSLERHEYDAFGNSQFDKVAAVLCAEFETAPPTLISVEADDLGGFVMNFSSDYRLDIFPDGSSKDDEFWRIFEPGAETPHFVVSSDSAHW